MDHTCLSLVSHTTTLRKIYGSVIVIVGFPLTTLGNICRRHIFAHIKFFQFAMSYLYVEEIKETVNSLKSENTNHQQMHKESFIINCNTLLHVSTLLGHLQGELFVILTLRLHFIVE
jgi:hypothetical protein